MSTEAVFPASSRRPARWTVALLVALPALVLGAALSWAVVTVLQPAEEAVAASPYTTVSVAHGEVGSSITLNTVARWTSSPIGVNRAPGVVTTVDIEPGAEVSQGSPIYTVDLRPVVVAQGAVPAFRPIAEGSEGPDVVQAQAMLTAKGFYGGPADGKAGRGTVRAITEWQKSLGVAPTGVIEVGDIIFVTSLPTRVALDEGVVKPGATLSGGEPVLQGLSTAPRFEVPVTSGQAAMMPEGTKVNITSPTGDTWVALAGTQQSDVETGSISVALTGEADGSICAGGCGQIPVVGEALLSSTIVTVPTAAGLVVPSAALVSDAEGNIAVITVDGERLPVTVVAAARGMSVVEGVDEGTKVRVPGEGSSDAAG